MNALIPVKSSCGGSLTKNVPGDRHANILHTLSEFYVPRGTINIKSMSYKNKHNKKLILNLLPMTNNNRDFLKEALKTEIELLKLFSVFLVALVSAFAGMVLGGTYNKSTIHLIFFFATVSALIVVWFIFLIFVRNILRRLKHLKKDTL